MHENGCYNVILQRTGRPGSIVGNKLSGVEAYTRLKELTTNMVDNGGYTFTNWLAGKRIARLERDNDVVFIAMIELGEATS